MEVNDETGALADMLQQSVQVLKTRRKNRRHHLSFHRRQAGEKFLPVRQQRRAGGRRYVRETVPNPNYRSSPKPVIPLESELRSNPRSRSAKLRIAQKKTTSVNMSAENRKKHRRPTSKQIGRNFSTTVPSLVTSLSFLFCLPSLYCTSTMGIMQTNW